MKKIAIFAGSFDPITLGHLDIIERAQKIFDELVILVGENSEKKTLFSPEKRLEMVERCCKQFVNVKCAHFSGLLVNELEKFGANVIIRGVRNSHDFTYEQQLAQINKKINPKAETLLLFANSQFEAISSSAAREILKFHGDLSLFVPEEIKSCF